MSGHDASKIIVINLQYGPSFSGPGNDIFRLDRATGDPSEAHQSNFLHPALYYYDKLPSGWYLNTYISFMGKKVKNAYQECPHSENTASPQSKCRQEKRA